MRSRRLVAVATVLSLLLLPAPPAAAAAPRLSTAVIQGGLVHPWDVAFTPDGRMLVTERPGRIRVYASRWRNARLLSTKRVDNVRAEGEAGVMGIATKRKGDTMFVFVCASRTTQAGWRNQVLRYRLGKGGGLRFDRLVLGGMHANTHHNGCAVQIGPDGKVWVSMGDAGDLSLPQNRRSRNGKILRVNLNGSVPSDNPFAGSPVYALGLRNPQGIAFAPGTGRAYSIEHGPDVHDEINRLRPGRNYGWPCWTGRSTRGPRTSGCGSASDYSPPAWSSGTGGTLATSNGVFLTGRKWAAWRRNLLVATLKEQDLRRFESNDTGSRVYPRTPALFDTRWGRLRSVVRPGDNAVYVTTSNGDGNDRVIRIRAN
jgi:glucose/arabinose dehydrogenase